MNLAFSYGEVRARFPVELHIVEEIGPSSRLLLQRLHHSARITFPSERLALGVPTCTSLYKAWLTGCIARYDTDLDFDRIPVTGLNHHPRKVWTVPWASTHCDLHPGHDTAGRTQIRRRHTPRLLSIFFNGRNEDWEAAKRLVQ